MAKNRWKIHKFGGSSLADADCFRRVAGLMLDRRADRIGVVVSAMGGMTDALLKLAQLAMRDDDTYEAELAVIGERYSTTTSELLDGKQKAAVLDAWSKDADDVRDVLKAIALVKSAPQRSRDVVAGYGEIWSARLLAAFLAIVGLARAFCLGFPAAWTSSAYLCAVNQRTVVSSDLSSAISPHCNSSAHDTICA